jgi:hypothetical protein
MAVDAARLALASASADERAAGALALAVEEPATLEGMLRSSDPAIVRSAARALLIAPEGAARVAAERLVGERDPLTAAALALALARPGAERAVPSHRLMELVERGGGAAFLAARAIAARNEPRFRDLLNDFLAQGERWLQAHVALGLGSADEAATTAILVEAYRFETDSTTRRSVVLALASREGAARRQTLQHAATLDPDVGVRSAARLVLEGVRIGVDAVGNGAAWLSVEAAGGARPAASAAVLTAAGLALPVIADPDGAIVLLGLPAGPIDLRVATDAKAGKAPSSSGGKKTHQR